MFALSQYRLDEDKFLKRSGDFRGLFIGIPKLSLVFYPIFFAGFMRIKCDEKKKKYLQKRVWRLEI